MQQIDAADGVKHVRDAIRSREWYVLLSETQAGDDRLTRLADAITQDGTRDADLVYGLFDWLDGRTGLRTPVSFLTIPKREHPLLADALRKVPTGHDTGHPDLWCVSDTPERTAHLLHEIDRGTCRLATDPGNG